MLEEEEVNQWSQRFGQESEAKGEYAAESSI